MTVTSHLGKRIAATGVVTAGPKHKTIVVRSSRLVQHPVYHRYIRKTTVYKVHDETDQARPGDMVEIMECRPISKTKHWRLVRVLSRRGEKGSEGQS